MHDLDISPTAIVARLVDAFTHLFNETGIDRSLTLDDIENLSLANLEELFEALIPLTVRSGFDTGYASTLTLRTTHSPTIQTAGTISCSWKRRRARACLGCTTSI